MRPPNLTARHALSAGHDEGAAAWARIASLIETCKMNGVKPYAWMKSKLETIAAGHPQSKIDELLPWNFDQAASKQVKVRRSHRLRIYRRYDNLSTGRQGNESITDLCGIADYHRIVVLSFD